MEQLDLFANGLTEKDFDTAKQSSNKPKIYESPDGGKTVYARDFGSDPSTRTIVQNEIEYKLDITFGSPNGA